ncbi:MAG: PrgI family protein [Candidatus Gracilibacteria bacterium]
MQFKVPQNVQMEDKIVGPLTLKQLIICAIGGGIAYFIYISTSKIYLMSVWLPATAVPALLTIAIAFVKIHDISFIKFVFLQLERLIRPNKTHFEKGDAENYKSVLTPQSNEDKKTDEKRRKKEEEAKEKIKNLDTLTKILDSQGKINS